MKTIHVAAAIIYDNDRILAARRGYGEFKGGWEFPGGKVETGESSASACIREIHEELNITLVDPRYLCTVEHDYDSFHLTMDCFLCSMPQETISDTEHEDMRWLDAASINTVNWLPADIKVVQELERSLPLAQTSTD